ncbi:MAG: hypothetical protein ACK452_07360, partial [Bacteroidota bacterium]
MKKYFFSILCISILYVKSQTIWTIGPMIHFNFGEDKLKVSYNIEAAYWNYAKFPWSVDFAVEF